MRPSSFRTPFARHAARTNDDNFRHWANADHVSPEAAHSPAIPRTLRNRARYEIANNSYARGIVDTIANFTIGTGPRLPMLLDDPVANKAIEQRFSKWAEAVNLAEKLRTIRMARCGDGEAFAIFINNEASIDQVKLDIKLVEADQIESQYFNSSPGMPDQAGIEYDRFGNPSKYWLLKTHPGDLLSTTTKADPIPADQVIRRSDFDTRLSAKRNHTL